MIGRFPPLARSFVLALAVLAVLLPLISPRADSLALRLWIALHVAPVIEARFPN